MNQHLYKGRVVPLRGHFRLFVFCYKQVAPAGGIEQCHTEDMVTR